MYANLLTHPIPCLQNSPLTHSHLLNNQFNAPLNLINHPTPKPTHPTMTKSSTEKSPNPQNFQLRWRNCPFPAIFPPRTTSFPTRPALHTNTIQMWNKYISDAAQIHKYNTAHEPTLLLSLWLPVLPQLPRVRELFTQKLPTESVAQTRQPSF